MYNYKEQVWCGLSIRNIPESTTGFYSFYYFGNFL